MGRNIFRDPNSVLSDYSWQMNHSQEEDQGKSRQIEKTANTANTGFIRQQSDSDGLVLHYSGTILHKAQLQQMVAWYNLCDSQTIFFTDFAGDQYEIIITDFKATRHPTIRNPRDYTNAPLWYWKFDISMDVVRIIDSVWEGIVT
jgi:hypothetical protein